MGNSPAHWPLRFQFPLKNEFSVDREKEKEKENENVEKETEKEKDQVRLHKHGRRRPLSFFQINISSGRLGKSA